MSDQQLDPKELEALTGSRCNIYLTDFDSQETGIINIECCGIRESYMVKKFDLGQQRRDVKRASFGILLSLTSPQSLVFPKSR